MKTFLAVLLLSTVALAQGNHAVRGYVKPSTGTYVAPHRQTNPDRTQRNNWSSKGNVNPYTGKVGTKTPKR
jgi:hypothetical protein